MEWVDAGSVQRKGGNPAERGSSQAGVKAYNERLVLSLVRTHGALSKVEMARITGLSPQTSAVIMRQLERDGLLVRREPLRGKVGQPLIPFSLNPEGAFSIGLKFGRRSADLVLMDFVGAVRRIVRCAYAFPEPQVLEGFVRAGVDELTLTLSDGQRRRICGMGIAAPFEMWSWEAEVGTPPRVGESWKAYDIAREVRAMVPWPVQLCNDATAACAAELAFGSQAGHPNFFYIFIATLIGGGVVLNGGLYAGRAGYAGSFGSILVPDPSGRKSAERLIRCASLCNLEDMLREAGRDTAMVSNTQDWSGIGPILDRWLDQTSGSISMAISSVIAVLDFEAIVIDGAFPPDVRGRLVDRIRERFTAIELQGVAPVKVLEGTIGSDARVLGAASLPLLANFERNREVLFVNDEIRPRAGGTTMAGR
jgi:predicted NBD/HSP70 family sugar kinase